MSKSFIAIEMIHSTGKYDRSWYALLGILLILVGGWATHLKNMIFKFDHFSIFGMKINTSLSCHHLVIVSWLFVLYPFEKVRKQIKVWEPKDFYWFMYPPRRLT